MSRLHRSPVLTKMSPLGASIQPTAPHQGMWSTVHPAKFPADRTLQILRNGIFADTSLAELGLLIQLNHRRGNCPQATTQTRGFTVYHTNGVHYVNIAYCACRSHLAHNSRLGQIFRQRWLPATWKRPRTAFTFACMNQFHLLNLQSKCNLYDYYHALLRITDNGDLKDQPVSKDWYNMQAIKLNLSIEPL
jgi:hypothetical protein